MSFQSENVIMLLLHSLVVSWIVVGSAFFLTDETTEQTGISANELSSFTQQLTSQGQIISDLKIRIVERRTVFDVTIRPNPEMLAWLIQVNVSDSQFRESSRRYTADGFQNTVHRVVPNGPQNLHSTIWVQKSEGVGLLKLPEGSIPATGDPRQNLEPISEVLLKALTDNNIPGATVCVARNGVIVGARGFGYADLESNTPMAPDARIRIASISKPIIAVAVLLLMEDGKLQLDDLVIDFLKRDQKIEIPNGIDTAWNRLTIRHLLQHSGGWNRDKSRDPIFELVEITRALKLRKMARVPDIVRYQLMQPMDFEPGSEYQYSNFGYCLLGRVIEVASGQSCESFVSERILIPAGMNQTQPGRTKFRERAENEAHYYTQKLKLFPAIWDIAPGRKSGKFELVAAPYGQWDLDVMGAQGAWISTASDLVRFAIAIDAPSNPLLKPESLRLMQERPSFVDSADDRWYGLGWNARSADSPQRINLWHDGVFAGSSAILVKRWDQCVWAVLFNVDESKDAVNCAALIDEPMYSAVDRLFSEVEAPE